MKRPAKNLLLLLILSALLVAVVYQAVVARARTALISHLQRITAQSVSIQSISYRFPATFLIDKLEIGERKDQKYLFVDRIRLFAAPWASLLQRRLVIGSLQIVSPRLFYERESAQSAAVAKPVSLKVAIPAGRLDLVNGTAEFIDRGLAVKRLAIVLNRLNGSLSLKNGGSAPRVIEFNFAGDILLGKSSPVGKLSFIGWTDLDSRLTQARLEVKRVDGIYLYPYYSVWLDLEKARFEQALFDFSADIAGKGKKFTAACRLELTESRFKALESGREIEQPQKLAILVVDILKAAGNGRAVVDFNLEFDADKPGLDWSPLAAAFQQKIDKGVAIKPGEAKNVLKLPQALFKNTVGRLGDITKGVVDQSFLLGQQVRQSVQDTFIKVTPKKPN